MTVKKAKKKTTTRKSLGLFDHINAVKEKQDPSYFSKISDDDKKTWSNWMILRALSYNKEYTECANELQVYCHSLPAEVMYKLLIDLIPKARSFDKFINGKKDKYPAKKVELMAKYFEISQSEAIDYMEVFNLTDDGKAEMITIFEKYGNTQKEIKKWK